MTGVCVSTVLGLQSMQDGAEGMQVLFLGGAGNVEATMVPKHGFQWQAVPIVKIHRPLFPPRKLLRNVLSIFKCAPSPPADWQQIPLTLSCAPLAVFVMHVS